MAASPVIVIRLEAWRKTFEMIENSHGSWVTVGGAAGAAASTARRRRSSPGVAAVVSALAVTLAAWPARAREPNESVDTGRVAGSVFDEPAPRLRKLGLMFDLGTLDGGMMSLVYRPLPYLRFHGGGGTNGAGPGVRVGAALQPLRNSGWSLSLDGGHFFPGNVNGVFAAFAGSDYDDSHLLEHFDYDFVNLQAGWEVERNDLLFFARAGVGFLWTELPSENLGRIRNLSGFVDPDGSVEALLPSLKVGIIGFL
jgi:hypothetical protein